MKAIIVNKKEKPEYPKLMISPKYGQIVLMHKERCGVVINENKSHPIGTYSETWIMDDHKPFDGTVELSND